MADSPLDNTEGQVEITITSEGNAIPDTYEVISVRTRAETNRIPEALIVLQDGDVAEEEFPATDSDTFKPGAEIEIKAGYGDEEQETVFKGIVVSIRLRIGDGQSKLEVSCRDKAIQMTLGRKSAVYNDMTDSDITSALISDYGLTPAVDATSIEHPALVQTRSTDWDFMLNRADANGMTVNVSQGELTIKAPDTSAPPKLTITFGTDLISFDCEVDARHQYANYKAESWDMATLAKLSSEAAAASSSDIGNLTPATLAETGNSADMLLTTSGPIPSADLTAVTDARSARAGLAALRGTVRYQGSAKAVLGGTLELKGVGDRFSGTGLVGSIVHRIEDGTWYTDAGLGLKVDWHSDQPEEIEAAAAAGLVPPLRGLQIGKVVKLADDPDSQERIQISLPLVAGDTDDALVWARYSAPYATAGSGLALLPEIGDEVVVAFLDDNPTHPVILGSLHSNTNARPVTATDDNYLKTFLSREQMKLEFDEENKTITISTPAGNTAVLDDSGQSITLTDQTGNSITLDTSGITLDSASDISITAAAGVTISASADVSISGMNVSASADVGFTGSGSASAELSSGGTATVSGSLVQIN